VADRLPRQLREGEVPAHLARSARVHAAARWRAALRMLAQAGVIAGLGLYAWDARRQRDALAADLVRAAQDVRFVVVRDDGTVMARERFDLLPPHVTENGLSNALWAYARHWACYTPSTAAQANYRVQRMSSPEVGEQWRRFFRASNEQSPQVTLGRKGHWHDCQEIGTVDRPGGANTMGFRFLRQTRDERGNPVGPEEVVFTALAYRTGVFDAESGRGQLDTVTFNAPGIHVTQVTRPYVEGGGPRLVGGGAPR
jgi:VirB8 protein